jgi:hypothetical protein
MTPWISERLVGNPINLTYIPNAWTHAGNSMTLYSRVKNTLLTGMIYLWEISVSSLRGELFRRKYFPEIEWSDAGSADLLFLNSHPTLQPRPMVPNAIEIGGVHIPSDASLPNVRICTNDISLACVRTCVVIILFWSLAETTDFY